MNIKCFYALRKVASKCAACGGTGKAPGTQQQQGVPASNPAPRTSAPQPATQPAATKTPRTNRQQPQASTSKTTATTTSPYSTKPAPAPYQKGQNAAVDKFYERMTTGDLRNTAVQDFSDEDYATYRGFRGSERRYLDNSRKGAIFAAPAGSTTAVRVDDMMSTGNYKDDAARKQATQQLLQKAQQEREAVLAAQANGNSNIGLTATQAGFRSDMAAQSAGYKSWDDYMSQKKEGDRFAAMAPDQRAAVLEQQGQELDRRADAWSRRLL